MYSTSRLQPAASTKQDKDRQPGLPKALSDRIKDQALVLPIDPCPPSHPASCHVAQPLPCLVTPFRSAKSSGYPGPIPYLRLALPALSLVLRKLLPGSLLPLLVPLLSVCYVHTHLASRGYSPCLPSPSPVPVPSQLCRVSTSYSVPLSHYRQTPYNALYCAISRQTTAMSAADPSQDLI